MEPRRGTISQLPTFAQVEHRDYFHAVQFYASDDFIVDTVSSFIGSAFQQGDAAIVIATDLHRAAIERSLAADGIDVHRRYRGEYVALDIEETLAQLLIDGWPNGEQFDAIVGGLIRRFAEAGRRVHAFGEMVAVLWASGHWQAALELEKLWNELGAHLPFSLLCAYPIGTFDSPADSEPFRRVCGAHAHVSPAEGYSALQTNEERLRAVADLQRSQEVLHGETAARAATQKALERSERELADFFDNGPVPLHWVAADGTIVRANQAELDLLGYSPDEYVGHNVAEFYADPRVATAVLARLRNGEILKGFEVELRHKNGTTKVVHLDSNAYFEDGEFIHTRCVMRDVTDDRRAEEMAARLAAIVECSDDAIISKSLDGVITSWNRGAERLFGYRADEMIGQPLVRLVPADLAEDFGQIIETLAQGERIEHYETDRLRKDGTRINVSISVSPIIDSTGRIIGASKIARDVTERRQAEQARAQLLESERKARAEAEAATLTKDQFLSVITRELRTPSIAILEGVAALKSAELGDGSAAVLDAIERSSRTQAKLIDDLLDVSRVITGHMRLQRRIIDLQPIVRQAVETIRPAAEAKGVALDVSFDPDAGPVGADPDRIEQIVWNLLSNAVKFTPAGGQVELRLERRNQELCIVVSDTGRGISPDFLPHVFERFRQADTRGGGLGLGLAIVRHLAELHGGSVAATSDGEGAGATFTVTLPITVFATNLQYQNGKSAA